MKLGDIDLYDLAQYEREGPPHAALRTLRERAPVFWHPEPDGPGFWVISRHADIQHCSTQPLLFSSAVGGTNIEDHSEDELVAMRALIINMDPPQHSKYRKLVNKGFTPRMIAKLTERVQARAIEIFDAVADRDGCDLVEALAARLPLQLISELIGVPDTDREQLYEWTKALMFVDDPDCQKEMGYELAAMQIIAYGNELAERKRRQPEEDLMTNLVRAEVDGEMLSDLDLGAFVLMLAVAGSETTRNLLSVGTHTLIEHRDQFEALRADRSLLEGAVEEMLRWVTPVMYFRRTATADTELHGQAIAAGDKIAMYHISANRDDTVFERPDAFDIRRNPNDHLTFGVGEHYCLGANLARLEARMFFDLLLDRLPRIELAAPPVRLRSNFIHGYKAMPVKW